MINAPEPPSPSAFDRPESRPRGRRGDTTQTYVRRAQEKAERGEAIPVGAATTAERGGLRAMLAKLWPFRRGA